MKDVNMIGSNAYPPPNVMSIGTSETRHRNVEIIQKEREKTCGIRVLCNSPHCKLGHAYTDHDHNYAAAKNIC